jgi:hypothetical protein
MAAVPGFRHDIFVSYAHADNVPVAGTESGFIDRLVADLRTEVGRKFVNGIDVWWDHYKLAGNILVTPEIMSAARDCACIVIILSPAYLRSEWCDRERGAFLEFLGTRLSSRAGAVFTVIIDPVDQGQLPTGLKDLTGYSFYRQTESGRATRPLHTEFAQDKEPYCNRLVELAQDVSNYLKGLAEDKTARAHVSRASSTVVTDTTKTSVLLMEVTDDVVQRRAEVKSYLEQAGVVVLPAKRYSRDDVAVHKNADAGGPPTQPRLRSDPWFAGGRPKRSSAWHDMASIRNNSRFWYTSPLYPVA